jgi:DNA polymerase iota
MDVSDIVEYNLELLNPNDLATSFFCLSKADPTAGFPFDASRAAGYTYPELNNPTESSNDEPSVDACQIDRIQLRLHLASYLASHLRKLMHAEKGYTCTVGISTNKLLSKLAGNLHKPDAQTTLLPHYVSDTDESDNVTAFLDGHEIGKLPGIGFKMAHKIREYVLQRQPSDAAFEYGGIKETVLVADVRKHPTVNAETLERLFEGPGSPHGIGRKVWGLLNGVDDSEVGEARDVPKQISIEDSYLRLDSLDEVIKELGTLAKSLLRRMHTDLLESEEDEESNRTLAVGHHSPENTDHNPQPKKRWSAYPKTLRLSSRPRPPRNADGTRTRSSNRISRSTTMPNFVFSLTESVDNMADRLVAETLLPLFRKLHPEKSGWDLSLLNIAATNMADAANDSKGGAGRDISKMFKRQDTMRKEWSFEDEVAPATDMRENRISDDGNETWQPSDRRHRGSEDIPSISQEHGFEETAEWEEDEEDAADDIFECERCGAIMPVFASAAHDRWHRSHESGI